MAQSAETKDETETLLFGLSTLQDWLDKAKRELDRFLNEEDNQSRTDHAINLAVTLSHLEDWAYRLYVEENKKEWPDHQKSALWDDYVRRECPAMQLLADLCNAAKHRVLHRRLTNTNKAEIGGLNFIVDDTPYAQEFIDRVKQFSTILSVRTLTKDNEFSGYEVRTETHKLVGPAGFKLFVDVCNEAIAYWDEFLQARAE